ncbi:Ppx/GppA phosphatase family protein [Rhizobium sp. CSW-27]|uniref:Ppx/GppA phosphatase family protein n=1 Tax=Rhizobium sp. CSW-27 TaxID=2839985 RepID=UPI00207872E6|nr:Ppx/GppA phosphatase family protein [Rhizobium sp. CSW-27]
MNPDSGGKPPEGGASAAGRTDGKAGRRRKAKRSGKPFSAAAAHGIATAKAADARRLDDKGDGPPRKRKRRRSRAAQQARSGGAGADAAGESSPAARSAQPPAAQPSPEQGVSQAVSHDSPSGRRRKRGRKKSEGRGPQGRPLAVSGKGAPGKGHAGNVAAGQGSAGASGRSSHAQGGHSAAHGAGQGHGHGHGGQGHGGQGHGSGSFGHHRSLPEGRGRGALALPEAFEGARGRSHPDDLYAALDLGTNNCRLLIAQPTRPGQFRVVDAFSRIVRLGEGLAKTGRLSDEAMDRAVEALRICASKLAHRPVRKMRLIATEACRAAANGEAFLERVTRETGLQLEIIDRETEARLAVSGCSSLVGREARSVVLFDIGGGSSEIAVIRIRDNRSSRLANHITHWTSLPVGVVTLSERHGGRNVTPDVFAAMVAEVEGMLAGFHCPSLEEEAEEDFHLIGTSGTVTTLAGVHLDLPRYDRRKVDGLWLTDQEVSAMQARLLSWDFDGRASNPCIGPDRADLVLAGCAILEAIRRRWPSRRMRVADRGLREGLLTDMMADDGVWRRMRRRPAESTPRTATEKNR